jgi:phospholipid/cholesterol/gamma-HCH transport system substrate-binding protein
MNQSRHEWKIGLFVFIGLVLLAALLIGFSKGLTFFRSTYEIYLRAANVSGLKTRASVLMSGVQIGTVSDIRLSPSGTNVVITLRIFSEYPIHKDARFVIEQSGFLGDEYVAILTTRNEGAVFNNHGLADAEEPFNLQEFTRSASGFITRIDQTVTNLNGVLLDLTRVVLNPTTLTNVSLAVGNLRNFSDRALTTVNNLNELLETNGPVLFHSVTNLAAFSDHMDQFGSGLNDLLATNRPGIEAALKNIESSTEVLKSLLNDVQAGKGVAGDLLRNEQMAASVSQIANNLSITSSNLNRLGLWGILWQRRPPGTNAPSAHALTTPKNPYD